MKKMKNINNLTDLRREIESLRLQQGSDVLALKEQAQITYESLKLVNLLKGVFKDLTSTTDFKDGLVNSSLGLGVGYLTKKVVLGATHNPLKQLIGILLQSTVTNVVSKNGDDIKESVYKLIGNLIKKIKESRESHLN